MDDIRATLANSMSESSIVKVLLADSQTTIQNMSLEVFRFPVSVYLLCCWKCGELVPSGQDETHCTHTVLQCTSNSVVEIKSVTPLSWSEDKALHSTLAHCTALHCIKLHCIVSYCTALYHTVLHCISLYCTVSYCTALHHTVLRTSLATQSS